MDIYSTNTNNCRCSTIFSTSTLYITKTTTHGNPLFWRLSNRPRGKIAFQISIPIDKIVWVLFRALLSHHGIHFATYDRLCLLLKKL